MQEMFRGKSRFVVAAEFKAAGWPDDLAADLADYCVGLRRLPPSLPPSLRIVSPPFSPSSRRREERGDLRPDRVARDASAPVEGRKENGDRGKSDGKTDT